ncbi:MAG: hypothetical protein Q8P83_04010 [bacterium]|nr:hypothetical protein [bacterium]
MDTIFRLLLQLQNVRIIETVLWPFRQLANAFLAVAEWADEHIHNTVVMLSNALWVNMGLLGLGLAIEWLAYNVTGWIWLLGFGRGIASLAGAIAAALWLFVFIRIWVLTEAAVIGNQVLSGTTREVSRPLPSRPVEIPEFLDQVLADRILRGVMSGLAVVALGSAYAAFVPVYTNLSAFFVAITLTFGIAFTLYEQTVLAGVSESGKAKRWIRFGTIVVLAIITVGFFYPYDSQRFYKLREAEGRATLSASTSEARGIERLEEERNTILLSLPNLIPAQEKRLGEINQLITEIRQGKYTGSTFWGWKETLSDLRGSVSDMDEEMIPWFVFFAAVGCVGVLIAVKGGKSNA